MTDGRGHGTVIVTGGAGGIAGAVIAALLETTDHRCVSIDLETPEQFADHDRAMLIQADLTDPDEVARAVAAAAAWGGPIVGLVNSMGAVNHTPTLALDHATWRRVLAVHVDGTFLASQEVAKRMAAGDGGSIVNMGSVAMFFGWPERLAYAAAKGAIGAMTRTLAVEWAELGIRVNCVAPGYVDSKLVADLIERDVIDGETYRNLHALKRFGAPREVADVILFLLSDAAAYVTGETVRVDGGFSAVKLPRDA